MHFLADYGLFLAKVISIVISLLLLFAGLIAIASKGKQKSKEHLEVKNINKKYEEMAEDINAEILDKAAFKKFLKEKKSSEKSLKKNAKKPHRIFVLNFDGDVKASEVTPLREEITAILNIATAEDEVVVCLESSGGLVHAYGLAASQLERIKKRKITLTVAVDKVAASGGYLMACVADRILAAPFAIIGSIGVLAQVPNFHRLLKKNSIDFEQITAGEYKRTISLFGENTERARKKFQQELEDVHLVFKDFILQHRPAINLDEISTGEHWLATQALALKLVDKLITSDDYLLNASKHADIYEVSYYTKPSLTDRLFANLQLAIENSLLTLSKGITKQNTIF